MKPQRIQRKRTKGWRMPGNTVYVGRGSRWGNPYKVWEGRTPEQAVAMYCMFRLGLHWPSMTVLIPDSQAAYREAAIAALRGKDLACWCPLVYDYGNRVPCHADLLLELANRKVKP